MFRSISLFCVSLALLFGCQKRSVPSTQTVKINIESDPQSLDPRFASNLKCATIMHMLFEGLTRVSKKGSTELALAEKVEISNDCTRFVFYLRKTVWSNGDPVTSKDFAASWKSSLDPEFATDLAYQLYVIKGASEAKKGLIGLDEIGVRTPDDCTLIVELEHPAPYFLELLTLPIFLPVHLSAIENPLNGSLRAETYVSNGPFSLQFWKHSDLLSVKKNPSYWEAETVKLDQIDMLMLGSDTEIRMFEDHQIDWAGSPLSKLPIDSMAHLKAQNSLMMSPLSGTNFLRVNTLKFIGDKKNPLSSSKFRKALASSIDRSSIAKHILQGGQLPAFTLVPSEMGLSTRISLLDDLAAAKEMCSEVFNELGLERTEPITLSFLGSERNASIVQALQKQWEANLGLTVILEAVEPKVYFQRVSQKNFQLAVGDWIADFNDPINFLEVFKYKASSTNNTGWEDPKYIDLLNRSAICKETDERKRLLSEAESILIEQMPIIPIFHAAMNYLQEKTLEEVSLSPIGQIDFRWAHFVEPHPK